MATKQEKEQVTKSIKEKFSLILNFDLERDLIRKEELGLTLNFENLKSTLIKYINNVKRIDALDFNEFTWSRLEKLNEVLGQSHARLMEIKNFTPNQGQPQQVRDRLINNFENYVDHFNDAAETVLLSSYIQSPNNDLQSELAQLIKKVKDENENARKESAEKLQEINQILENAKSASLKVGVSSHSSVFAEESKTHSGDAKTWMKRLVWMLVATAAVAITFFLMMFCPELHTESINPIHFALSKIVILAILFFGISLCSKNYKAHKHNAIVNKHRQNALNTFETFIKASTDDQTKNAVLLQTTQSIFSSQNTGYNSAENDSDMPNKIIEIVKSTGTKNS